MLHINFAIGIIDKNSGYIRLHFLPSNPDDCTLTHFTILHYVTKVIIRLVDAGKLLFLLTLRKGVVIYYIVPK